MTRGLLALAMFIIPAIGATTAEPLHRQIDVLIAASAKGKPASAVSGDGKAAVKQWDASSGKVVHELDARSMYAVFALQELGGTRVMRFDAGGTTLDVGGALCGSKDLGAPRITLFDWASGKAAHTIKLPGKGYVYDLAFHADGFLMAVTNGSPGQGMLLFVRPGEETPFFQKALSGLATCSPQDGPDAEEGG